MGVQALLPLLQIAQAVIYFPSKFFVLLGQLLDILLQLRTSLLIEVQFNLITVTDRLPKLC